MALNFDARKAPRNHAELEKLVQAVRQASKADETIWLEWKSELDLNPADKGDKSGRAHVARAIIGFANRMPEDAARFAEGYGFLLAGVSHDSMAGVRQHDITELVRWIRPYVGETINWQPTYVEGNGDNGPVSILVVTVDPPRWGDPIHCMRKEAPSPTRDKNIPEAAIFTRRADGTTARVNAKELDLLSQRLLRHSPSMELALEVGSGVATPISYPDSDVARLLGALEELALSSLNEHLANRGKPRSYVVMEIPEERTPEEYRQEVKRYLEKCQAKISEAVDETAAIFLAPIVLRLTNPTEAPLTGVQVVLNIPGDVRALEPEEAAPYASNDRFPRALPKPPVTFGPTFGHNFQNTFMSPPDLMGLRSLRNGPPVRIDNSGSTTVYFPSVDIHAGRHADLAPFVLIGTAGSDEGITAQWSATSSNMNGSLAGELHIPQAEPMSFLELFTAQPSDSDDEDE